MSVAVVVQPSLPLVMQASHIFRPSQGCFCDLREEVRGRGGE